VVMSANLAQKQRSLRKKHINGKPTYLVLV